MNIYLATDHAGFPLKEVIKAFLLEKGYAVEDCGAYTFDASDDYPDFIAKAAHAVAKDVDAMEKRLEKLASERENLISDSKLPISGLSFTNEGLELNGVPFIAGKVSDSQIMEVAAKLIIASNPTVKVFRIARGESLGQNRLQAIINIAKENGFQGFIEEVKRGQDELIIEEYTENE